jgi:hypothetical protein
LHSGQAAEPEKNILELPSKKVNKVLKWGTFGEEKFYTGLAKSMTTGIYHQNHGRISVFGCLAFWARLIVSIHCQCLSRKILRLTAQTIGAFINTKKNHQLSMLIFSCTFFNTFQPTQPIQADDSTTVAASLFNISGRDVNFCSDFGKKMFHFQIFRVDSF